MNTINTEKPTRNYTLECARRIDNEIATLELHREFINANRDKLEALNLKLDAYTHYVDFNSLDRPDVLRVIKAFPGRWEKSQGYDGRLNYTRIEPEGELTLRLWGAEAPDCCHIEERVEYVEVPARVEKRVTRVVKCPEPTLAPLASEDEVA